MVFSRFKSRCGLPMVSSGELVRERSPPSGFWQNLFLYYNYYILSSPEVFRESGRESERDGGEKNIDVKEKHQSVSSCTCRPVT